MHSDLSDIPATSFRDALFESGLILATGVDGVYGHSGDLDALITRLDRAITRLGAADQPEILRFPPTLSRRTVETSGYVQSFPHLLGTVHAYRGDELEQLDRIPRIAAHDDSWTRSQLACDVVLTPAACYPVYPLMAGRGPLGAAGRLIDVCSYCFRHEPSTDVARLQSFRIREFVRLGRRDDITTFRETWLARSTDWLTSLGLTHRTTTATDPFFGQAGDMLAIMQMNDELKFEIQIPCGSPEAWTACVSLNWHRDHFSRAFNLTTESGETAETGCVGFGLERLAFALIYRHGPNIPAWISPIVGTE